MRFSLPDIGHALLEGLAQLRYLGFAPNPFALSRYVPDESMEDTELGEQVSPYEASLLNLQKRNEEEVE